MNPTVQKQAGNGGPSKIREGMFIYSCGGDK